MCSGTLYYPVYLNSVFRIGSYGFSRVCCSIWRLWSWGRSRCWFLVVIIWGYIPWIIAPPIVIGLVRIPGIPPWIWWPAITTTPSPITKPTITSIPANSPMIFLPIIPIFWIVIVKTRRCLVIIIVKRCPIPSPVVVWVYITIKVLQVMVVDGVWVIKWPCLCVNLCLVIQLRVDFSDQMRVENLLTWIKFSILFI